MARITKAELQRENERLRRQESVQHLAVRYLALRAAPDFVSRAKIRDNGDIAIVRLEAFGLKRADGGVVVLHWCFARQADRTLVEAVSLLELTSMENRRRAIEMGRHELADAYAALYDAHVRAVLAA